MPSTTGPRIASLDGELRQSLGHIECGERAGGARDVFRPADDIGAEIVEVRLLERECLVGRAVDLGFQLAELHGRVADGAGERLAVDEGLGQGVRPLRRHLDVVAEHVVVSHLEGTHAGLGAIAGLQLADQAAAVIAQLHHLVERRIVAACDRAAVADAGRRALHQRARQALDQGLVMAERLQVGGECRRRRVQTGDGLGAEGISDRGNLVERIAHGGEVARPAASQAEPRKRALHVGAAAQPLPESAPRALPLDQEADGIQPRGDGGRVGKRRGEARPEKSCARAGDGAVDDREQAAGAAAFQRRRELQVAPGRGVDCHGGTRLGCAEPREPGQIALLGEPEIAEHGARCGELRTGEGAEAVERGQAVERRERAPGGDAIEERAGLRGENLLPLGEELEERRCLQQRLRNQELAGLEAGERRRQGRLRDPHHRELAGGHLGPGERERTFGLGERCEIVGRTGIQERVLAESPRRHQPDHLAADDRLRAPLARFRRVLHLLAHRDLEALADEPLEVALGAHHRHPAHRDFLPLVETPLGERDVERLRGLARIVEEKLVEVAHPVEEEVIRVGALDLEVLRHHRRCRLDAAGPLPASPRGAGDGRRGGCLRLDVIGHGGTLAHVLSHRGSGAKPRSCHISVTPDAVCLC